MRARFPFQWSCIGQKEAASLSELSERLQLIGKWAGVRPEEIKICVEFPSFVRRD
jgi:hypothetical protein